MKRFIILLVISLLLPIESTKALVSLEEEERIGKEVWQELSKHTELIQDQELNYYLNSLGDFLQKRGVKYSPFLFNFYLIKDSTFNAFSVPGGYIFFNSGIFETLESEDELAAIMAHEMAHNLARHVSKRIETVKKMQVATTAATLAAIFLGGAKVGEIVGLTSTALAQTKLLAYSRQDEEEADRLGFEIFINAGYNPQAMVRLMEKMARLSNFAVELNYRYLLTHPLSQERVVYLKNLGERAMYLPERDQYAFSKDDLYFKRLKVRVKSLGEDPAQLLIKLRTEVREKGEPWLRYTYALTLAKARLFKQAEGELLLALEVLPSRPYFLVDLAEIYLLSGNYPHVLRVLMDIKFEEKSPVLKIVNTKAKYLIGRSLAEMGDLNAAYAHFQELYADELMQRDQSFFYHFGLLCSRLDKQGESHFFFAKHYELKGDLRTAVYHYKRALSFLTKDTKMYVEAMAKVTQYEKKK